MEVIDIAGCGARLAVRRIAALLTGDGGGARLGLVVEPMVAVSSVIGGCLASQSGWRGGGDRETWVGGVVWASRSRGATCTRGC